MPKISLGPFSLDVKYLHKPKDRHTWHYRRLVPEDLRSHYSSTQILKSLKTEDQKLAMRRCLETNNEVECEFDRLRSGFPKEVPKLRYAKGVALLSKYDISPEDSSRLDAQAESNQDKFNDYLKDLILKKLGKVRYEEWERDEMTAAQSIYELLPEVERSALELIRGDFALTLSEYPEEYIRLKGREDDKKFSNEVRNAIAFVQKFLPDKRPSEYSRVEVRKLIDEHIEAGLKTQSIKRRLGSIRAMINKVTLELELREDKVHAFEKPDIPGLGEDAENRKEFTFDQLQELRSIKAGRSSEVVWLIHLMLETGMRIKECCGLRKDDVSLDGNTPYLRINKNPFRRLKTKQSKRFIPLVGVALEAVKEATEANGDDWLFPAYIDTDKKDSKNSNASAAINKRIKSVLGEDAATCHGFRHTMQTRLRQASCPKDIRDELGGWSKSISDQYGSTADIENKARYLNDVIALKHRQGV